jgi:hypothetical protein
MQWPGPGLEGDASIRMEPTQAIVEGAYGKFGYELFGLLIEFGQRAILRRAGILSFAEVFGQAIFPGGDADACLHNLALVNKTGQLLDLAFQRFHCLEGCSDLGLDGLKMRFFTLEA